MDISTTTNLISDISKSTTDIISITVLILVLIRLFVTKIKI